LREVLGMTRIASVLALALAVLVPATAGEKSAALGDKLPNAGGLRDLRGNGRTLHSFKDHAAVVVVFLGNDCPVSNLYLPSLLEMEKKYRGKNVQFLAVYPNES